MYINNEMGKKSIEVLFKILKNHNMANNLKYLTVSNISFVNKNDLRSFMKVFEEAESNLYSFKLS